MSHWHWWHYWHWWHTDAVHLYITVHTYTMIHDAINMIVILESIYYWIDSKIRFNRNYASSILWFKKYDSHYLELYIMWIIEFRIKECVTKLYTRAFRLHIFKIYFFMFRFQHPWISVHLRIFIINYLSHTSYHSQNVIHTLHDYCYNKHSALEIT